MDPVLRMVDSDEKPAMPFIYAEMDRAKEKIKQNFNNVKKSYTPIFNIIDERWEAQLHRPLHAAAYYLNSQYHYSPNFKSAEVKRGLYTCLDRMVPDLDERVKIDLQLDSFKNALGLFGMQSAILTRTKKSPADWWDSYGDDCPELQRFAIRVLSLTCSSSGCERNWSAFEQVHSKRRNRLHQAKMNDLVFVMYNLKLMERQAKRQAGAKLTYDIEDVPSDDEWITEKEAAMEKEDESDLDQDVENIVQNLTEACADELGLDQNFDDGAFVEGDEGEEDYHGEEGCSTGGHDTSAAASTSATLPELESVNLDDLY
ncbi:hypothetical protein ACP70R_047426 [Stipagrostis hirtigluma subsp. patula]